jgi:hypothetical protein
LPPFCHPEPREGSGAGKTSLLTSFVRDPSFVRMTIGVRFPIIIPTNNKRQLVMGIFPLSCRVDKWDLPFDRMKTNLNSFYMWLICSCLTNLSLVVEQGAEC